MCCYRKTIKEKVRKCGLMQSGFTLSALTNQYILECFISDKAYLYAYTIAICQRLQINKLLMNNTLQFLYSCGMSTKQQLCHSFTKKMQFVMLLRIRKDLYSFRKTLPCLKTSNCYKSLTLDIPSINLRETSPYKKLHHINILFLAK